jgi:hypothetical protein
MSSGVVNRWSVLCFLDSENVFRRKLVAGAIRYPNTKEMPFRVAIANIFNYHRL